MEFEPKSLRRDLRVAGFGFADRTIGRIDQQSHDAGRRFTSTPVIVVTAADLSLADRRRLNGGVEHILQKAASGQEDFLQQIRSLVGRYAVVTNLNVMDD
jgi:hypothetical protein